MRLLAILVLVLNLAACGSSSGDGLSGPTAGSGACSVDGQKQFVLDQLYTWYLWNDQLPSDLNIANYATPEELVTTVTETYGPQDGSGNPVDRFSRVVDAQADAEFFGEGKYEGFGFSQREVAPNDIQLTGVFAGSPADVAGLARGQRIVSLDGRSIAEVQAAEGTSVVFAQDTVLFGMQRLDNSTFSVSIDRAVVTIPPVPQWRVIDIGGGVNVGYMEFTTFVSTAEPEFENAFQAFRTANVADLIIDLRYNGGGLVSTAESLGDYLGGSVASNLIFSSTEYNPDRSSNNSIRRFSTLANSLGLSRLLVIASRGTASASELVTNGMIPHVDVVIVGDNTFGKPVGQIGLEFCDKLLRPTAFKIANADGDGDYFDGLPVDCPATDDLSIPVGDSQDPNMLAAINYINTGACPVVAVPGGQQKSTLEFEAQRNWRGPPQQELLNAY